MRPASVGGSRARLACKAIAVAWLAVQASDASAAPSLYDWPQFGGDPQHSGNNRKEAILSATNVASLSRTFHVSLPAVADGAPVVVTGAHTTGGGQRDMVFLTTKAGHIVALDAHSGATIWSHQSGPGTCTINGRGGPCYTTSSPAIDPGRTFVYSYGLDGRAHKYAVADGTEVTTGGWPELATNKPIDEKGSSALAIATAASGASYLYVASAGYPGDNGDYQGHVTAIALTDGSSQVFNTLCSDQAVHFVEPPATPDCASLRAAVWARGAVAYDTDNDKLFLATGNGDFVPASHDWGDSVLAIHPDGTGVSGDPIDSFTPRTSRRSRTPTRTSAAPRRRSCRRRRRATSVTSACRAARTRSCDSSTSTT